jgi:hypothetical protein
MKILQISIASLLVLICVGCGVSTNEASDTSAQKSASPTPSSAEIKSNWEVETETDDFGDSTTQVKSFATNSKGEKYGLYLSCDHSTSTLSSGIVGTSADGLALTWAKYDAEVKLDGGKVQTWKNSGYVEGMLSFEMGTKSLIRILEQHKTFSIKHLPYFSGGSEGIHMMTFDVSNLKSYLSVFEEAGCSI